jgi:hypothetical protein
MSRVTSYKCIYDSNNERFKFAMTLAGRGDAASIIVPNADAAETLLDMFEDARTAHFDEPKGELTFSFDELEADDEDENAAGGEDSDDSEDEASRDAA